MSIYWCYKPANDKIKFFVAFNIKLAFATLKFDIDVCSSSYLVYS